jgi:hypothetical protein
MDEVRWGPGSNAGRGAGRRPPGVLARGRRRLAERVAARVHSPERVGRQIATGLVVVGLVALLASQYFPWMSFKSMATAFTPDDGAIPLPASSTSIVDAGALLVPYYLCWLVALVMCGACVYASGRWRTHFFGGAIGSLAMVVVILLPIVRTPARLITASTLGVLGYTRDLHLVTHRSSGMVYALIAVLAFGLAGTVAVRGRVLPAATRPDEPIEHAPPPSHTLTVASYEIAEEPVAVGPDARDHSLYVRPRPVDYSKR